MNRQNKHGVWITSLALGALSAMAGPSIPFADDCKCTGSSDCLSKAMAAYSARADLTQVDLALSCIQVGQSLATDKKDQFDLAVLKSKNFFYQGDRATTSSDKKKLYTLGMTAAQEVSTINPDFSEGYYLHAINLGQWAIANGVLSSLQKKDEIMRDLSSALSRKSENGNPGEQYDGFGIDRVYGRLYDKLPSFAGGSRVKASKYLATALAGDRSFSLNWIYDIEFLITGNSAEKAEGKNLLLQMLGQDPANPAPTFDPTRGPETEVDKAHAQDLLNHL